MAKGRRGASAAGRSRPRTSKAAIASESSLGCAGTHNRPAEGWLAIVQHEMLTATYWFEAPEKGEPASVNISFTGRRTDRTGQPGKRDTFTQEEVVDGIVPGSGPVAVTTRVSGINPGEWLVTARPVGRRGPLLPAPAVSDQSWNSGERSQERTIWPGVTPTMPGSPTSRVRTALAPLVRVPGTVRFAWPILVGMGILIGLVIQAVLLARVHAPVGKGLLVSLSALLAGGVGAKAWYIAVHRGKRYDGWCIQGFMLGTALVAATLPLLVLEMSVGTFLDTVAPALLIGVFIGRPGCFLVGCCSGRPTCSRWGLWSADRRVAMRRIPTQLMESAMCLLIGVIALLLILTGPAVRPGSIFIGGLAAYTLGRQFILPLRVEPRRTTVGPRLVIAVSALVLAVDVAIAAAA